MDDLIKICDELEVCKKKRSCYPGEISCVRGKLEQYIHGDYDKLLKLKAQIIKNQNKSSGFTELIVLFVSILTLILNILKDISGTVTIEYFLYAFNGLLMLIIFMTVMNLITQKYKHRNSWYPYIEVVLEDLEHSIIEQETVGGQALVTAEEQIAEK